MVPGAADITVPAAVSTWKTWLPWAVAAALAAVVAGIGVWEARRQPIVQEAPLANARFSRFTDWEGTEAGAEISPDGKFVAFKADRAGQVDLWVSQVGTGRFSQPHRRHPTAELVLESSGPSAFPATARRSGSLREATSSAPKWLIPSDRRHAARVPGRGRRRTVLVSRRHPPRVLHERWRRSHLYRGSHERRRATARCRQRRLFRKRHAQPQSGLVTGWAVALLRARPGTDRRDERVARSTLGRHAGATDRVAGSGESSRANRPAHAALCRTRGRRVGTVALVA